MGQGYLGELVRIRLASSQEDPARPPSLIAKFASRQADTREFARAQNYYGREVGFYRDLGQDAGISVPRCFFAAIDPDPNEFCLLLEDLAPAEPSDQVLGTNAEDSTQVVEAFAALHARWWNDPRLGHLPWAEPLTESAPLEEGRLRLEASIRQIEAEGKFDAYPEMKALLGYLPALFRVKPPPPHPYSLVHGDLRSDNVFFPTAEGGRFCIIDWQCCGRDVPARDLARWLVQSMTVSERQRTERGLLDRYHAALVAHGVRDYPRKRLERDYELSIIVMYLMFSMGMDEIDTSPERADALFHAMFERLDAALADWKIGRILKVLPLLVPVMKVTTWVRQRLAG